VGDGGRKLCAQIVPPQVAVTRAAPAMTRMFGILILRRLSPFHEQHCMCVAAPNEQLNNLLICWR
jgi:hypothetical protein